MVQHNRIGVAYRLIGDDLDPAEITRRTGVIPTSARSWKRGDPLPGPRTRPMTYQFGAWSVVSDSEGTQPIDPSYEMDQRIAAVLAQLQTSWAIFVELGTQYVAELSCVVEVYEDTDPALGADRDTVKRLAELNAGFDIDLYCRTDWTDE